MYEHGENKYLTWHNEQITTLLRLSVDCFVISSQPI